MLSDEYFGAHKSEPQGKCNSSHMCPTGTCIINVFKAPGKAIKVNTHVDTQARPCVYACVCVPHLHLSFHSELNMHLHVQWEQMAYQEHFVCAANGDNSGKSLSQTVVDHFRCRRTNSSCHHAHISAGTAPPRAPPACASVT